MVGNRVVGLVVDSGTARCSAVERNWSDWDSRSLGKCPADRFVMMRIVRPPMMRGRNAVDWPFANRNCCTLAAGLNKDSDSSR